MFKFIKIDGNKFRVIDTLVGIHCEGTLDEMRDVMHARGVENSEVQAALDDMVRADTNCADFGAGYSGTGPIFTFSDRRKFETPNPTGVIVGKDVSPAIAA